MISSIHVSPFLGLREYISIEDWRFIYGSFWTIEFHHNSIFYQTLGSSNNLAEGLNKFLLTTISYC